LPSAQRLAKRLYYLDGFKPSDVVRHLSKKWVKSVIFLFFFLLIDSNSAKNYTIHYTKKESFISLILIRNVVSQIIFNANLLQQRGYFKFINECNRLEFVKIATWYINYNKAKKGIIFNSLGTLICKSVIY
jgi:hypothetical protein